MLYIPESLFSVVQRGQSVFAVFYFEIIVRMYVCVCVCVLHE